jgi:uncharacterized membrane protein YjdF
MKRRQQTATTAEPADTAERIHRWIVIAVVLIMSADLGWLLYEQQWMSAFLVVTIMSIILAPTLFGDRLPVRIPAEFQMLALLFAFGALFLGEIRNYYERIWWWDVALHVSSGLLLGILGFLLIYVLNENRRIDMQLRPRFVALFAFLFAVAMGTIWEIFEFSMDRLAGTNMQKPMMGDPSGLTDTMWDLIVDAFGALAISLYGWYYLRNPAQSFIDRWVHKFIDRNPGLFRA